MNSIHRIEQSKGAAVSEDQVNNQVEFKPKINSTQNLCTKLLWPGESEETFRSSKQAVTRPPVYHTRRRLRTVPFYC